MNSSQDARFLELETGADAGAWPERPGATRVLLVALNVPGYYSLAVRLLALTAHTAPQLRDAVDVRFWEGHWRDDPAAVAAAVVARRPALVAFTVNIWNRVPVLAAAAIIRRALPGTKILLGGQEVTNAVDNCLDLCDAVDYIIDGEGELPFVELLAAWDRGRNTLGDPEAVSGLHYRAGAERRFTGPARFVGSLDELPSPVLAGLVPVNRKNKMGVMIEGARSCPNQCSFCFEGGKRVPVRMASLERIRAEVDHMVAAGVRYFHLLDPILANSKVDRLAALAELFRTLKREHRVEVAVETYAQRVTEEIARALSAFSIIDIGLQSANEETMRAIRRPFNRERFLAGVDFLRDAGAPFNIYLISGLPHETLETYLANIRFVLDQKPTKFFMNELLLLNGTELRRRAEEFGYVYDRTPNYQVHATRWMGQRDLNLAYAVSKVVERRYNLSLRALFPSSPWAPKSTAATGRALIAAVQGCAGACTGCAGAGLPAAAALPLPAGLQQVRGEEVLFLCGAGVDAPGVVPLLERSSFFGAARLEVACHPAAFADTATIERVCRRGVRYFRTFVEAGGANAERDLATLESFRARAGEAFDHDIISGIDVTVRAAPACTPADYRSAVERVLRDPLTVVAVPAALADRGAAWDETLEALFLDAVERRRWVFLPPRLARTALGRWDRAEELAVRLEELGLITAVADAPPCLHQAPLAVSYGGPATKPGR